MDTKREVAEQVISLLQQGLSQREVASRMNLTAYAVSGVYRTFQETGSFILRSRNWQSSHNTLNKKMNMSALDKFKRRLVRDIARRKHQDKQPELEMFQQLKQEYGCDCSLLWDHMKALTLKKLKRLLAAEDRMDYITKVARMTSTDWLTYDLVLVHEKIDVIGSDMILAGKPEPKVLTELFRLIKKYQINNLSPRNLVEAWFNLTLEYNTGGRQASPMLLQRRWYQMQELTRARVYAFWNSYRGNAKLLEKANQNKPSKLQLRIAEHFPELITKPYELWESLIQMKQVVLAGAFEGRKRIQESAIGHSENDPDLIVVEPHVETIELAADSDSDNQENKTVDPNTNENSIIEERLQQVEEDLGVIIKTEPVDDLVEVEDTHAITDLENIQIPIETNTSELERPAAEQELAVAFDTMCVEVPEQTLPRITSVMGNVVIPPECHTEINETDKKEVESITQNRDTEVSDKEDQKLITITPLSDKFTALDHKEGICEKSVDTKPFKTEVISLLDELPIDLEFVDDGIDFVDNDCDLKIDEDDDDPHKAVVKQEALNDSVEENDTAFKIDKKLIMFPISYTKKLDDMDIFKNTSFVQVKGDHIIESALFESKPTLKVSIIIEEEDQDDSDDSSETVPRIKNTSWLLQKPKSRSYNPIQLCKNPDFNTRLKRLTVGFFTSERNRKLFSACKPVTIDLHKAFEDKLVDNTLYLESTYTPVIKQEKEHDACENSASVMPSAMPVQSLLDNSKVKAEELFTLQEDKKVPVTPINTNSYISERSKVINLPDLEQIRRLNQNLLTAEISPIPLKNSLCNNKPPVQLVKLAKEDTLYTQNNNPQTVSMPKNDDNEDLMDSQPLKTKRYVAKKTCIPKLKPSITIPSWSVCVSQERPAEECLLTKDTLVKVLGLLNGTEVNGSKSKKKKEEDDASKKRQEININETSEKNSQVITNENKFENVEESQEKDLKDVYLKILGIGLRKKSTVTKKNTAKPYRTIAAQSGYCCWARYKIQNFRSNGKRLRHLCPKPICQCCCRNHLVEEMVNRKELFLPLRNYRGVPVYTQDYSENTKSSDSNLYQKPNDIIAIDDLVNEINTNVVSSALTDTLIISTDTGTVTVNNSVSCIQSPLPNIIPPTSNALQESSIGSTDDSPLIKEDYYKNNVRNNDSSSVQRLTTDDNAEKIDQENNTAIKKPVKTRIISASTLMQNNFKVTSEKKSSKQKMPSTAASSSIIPSDSSSDKDVIDIRNDKNIYTNVETIILDDDEITQSIENSTPINDTNMLLPKGVNLLLLPDNSLSVSIDPGVEIDQAILSQLPEILTAVMQQLPTSEAIQLANQSVITQQIDNRCDINLTNQVASNASQIENQTNLVEDDSQNSQILNNAYNTILENSSSGNINVNLKTSDITENSVVLENTSNVQLEENTPSDGGEHINEDNTKLKDPNQVDKKNCSTNESNRKTILSDLMTMSGISPEDANQSIEEETPMKLPNISSLEIPSTSDTIIDYNTLNNPEYTESKESNNGQNNQIKKPIKKIVISIRTKRNVTNNTNSVIDLTDDCHDSGDISKTQSVDQSVQPLIKKYVVDVKQLKQAKAVREKTQPLRLFKAYQPSIVKKDTTRFVPLHDVTKEIKLAVGKHFAPRLNKKPTVVKILKRDAIVLNSNQIELQKGIDKNIVKGMSGEKLNRKKYETDSDSSDDEPLAKKSKRIRGTNTLNSSDPVKDSNNSIIPVPEYELPIEFLDKRTVHEKTVTHPGSDGEENCILGV